MQRVSPEAELRTLAECRYSFPAETLSDLREVRARFSDLRLYVDFYCFPNKEKKKLVYLAGTLPVYYEGAEYNIPVCIWLHETHPVSRPRCYVCPSVAMVINPSCPYVDASGNISVDALSKWSQGMSNLSRLVSEIRRAFQKDTPLFSRQHVQASPPAGVQVFQSADSVLSSSSSQHHVSPSSSHLSGPAASQLELCRTVRVGRSYTEDLLGIDFSAPPPSPSDNNPFISTSLSGAPLEDLLTRQMGDLRLDGESSRDQAEAPVHIIQSETARDRHTDDSGPGPGQGQDLYPLKPSSRPGADLIKMASRLPPDQAAVFLSLMAMEGRSFIPTDVIEAVQLNRDFQSALRFLSHSCPICQEQVSFSKIIMMTHCSCFLCQSCFKLFFLAAIKERSVDQLVCPQCGQPEVRGPGGLEGSMDYFNLLDTQIRHFLPLEIHELFQRKLRDRALQEMPNFCWCAHCSFGMLHEADSLRMDCPSCKKSTCSKCRSPWFPQHQSLSCEQFRVWKQKNQPDHHSSPLLYSSIECPNCQLVFSLSKGGCLHFICSQCQHQFCGGCSQRFSLGSACGFSVDCGSKGLHAHHPRDCLYHLRDWSITRLHLLLQHYRVSPSWLEAANGSPPDIGLAAVCLVLELRHDGNRQEEPCGRPALPEYRGYCQLHYKERLVELINRCRADPAVLLSLAEMTAELQRWQVAVPTRKPDEPEELYAHRLRLMLTNSVPLRKQRRSSLKLDDNLCPQPAAVVTRAPPPHLLSD
ncbi:E3 ubiquitin-protein ligase RNF31 isoform X2 [Acanthochromis polyacanthus]|uniref:E3 ubiquitin-protein ligase RNF31 isoform X2 n=1 Tax=Acanthochromis polyacanthus TaxID=80966 RepID=UPI0022347ADB|nr:E3 ubiquitin-protein ligase RNF31 isoform X2 [Acanthochromis polyacanthus]